MLIIMHQNEDTADKNSNKNKEKYANQIRKHFQNVVTVNQLCCDLQVPLNDGNVLAIERKSPNDFLSSIGDGRLRSQLERMARDAKYSAVIITGKLAYGGNGLVEADGRETGWKSASVRSMLRLVQLSGCILEYCPPSEYANMVEEIYNTVNKSDKHRSIIQNRFVSFPPIDERIQILANFPGVGLVLAESLLKFAGMMDKNADEAGYGTLAGALHWASIMVQIDQGSRPAGWGPKKILSFRKMLGLDSSSYLASLSEKNVEEE